MGSCAAPVRVACGLALAGVLAALAVLPATGATPGRRRYTPEDSRSRSRFPRSGRCSPRATARRSSSRMRPRGSASSAYSGAPVNLSFASFEPRFAESVRQNVRSEDREGDVRDAGDQDGAMPAVEIAARYHGFGPGSQVAEREARVDVLRLRRPRQGLPLPVHDHRELHREAPRGVPLQSTASAWPYPSERRASSYHRPELPAPGSGRICRIASAMAPVSDAVGRPGARIAKIGGDFHAFNMVRRGRVIYTANTAPGPDPYSPSVPTKDFHSLAAGVSGPLPSHPRACPQKASDL